MDLQFLLALQGWRESIDGLFNDFFVQMSDFSNGIFIWVLACVFFWAVNKKTGRYLFLNLGLARFAMQSLKLTFTVYRPWIREPAIKPVQLASGYSFPSGHSVTATTNYGTLIYRYRRYVPLVVFLCVMIALTLFSRLYIGAHTPEDVLVGFAVAVLVVIFAPRLWDWIDAEPNRVWWLLGGAAVLTVLFLVYISLRPYPLDYDSTGKLLVDPLEMQIDGWKDAGRFFGVACGIVSESRTVKFETKGVPIIWRVTRCCWGLLLLVLAEQVLMPWFTGSGELWTYFFACWWELFVLIAAWPAIFNWFENRRSAQVETSEPEAEPEVE